MTPPTQPVLRHSGLRPPASGLPLVACAFILASASQAMAVPIRGSIIDAQTRKLLPARLYIQAADGTWFFAKSEAPDGSAVEYRREHSKDHAEMHTTLSAHPFMADVPAGEYTLTVERGKEYLPVTRRVKVAQAPVEVEIELTRWINMAEHGWYSGDTHVHRDLAELPNAIMAEDVNVVLPLTWWVSKSGTSPVAENIYRGQHAQNLIEVDPTHVIWPINTEYEIFSVGEKQHTLGAVLLLNHRTPLDRGVPPAGPVAAQAREEGALLDLEKHSWPWSLMIAPQLGVDLFELANNHVWRVDFEYARWTVEAATPYMNLEMRDGGFTEWGWIDFGFQTYYALLNCGLRMRPTAGTASGVHPVPVGFGRVYVQLPDGFNYADWISGLDQGRSFVTTGPMVFLTFNGQPPGHIFSKLSGAPFRVRIEGEIRSATPLERIEVITNGRVHRLPDPRNERSPEGGYTSPVEFDEICKSSGWCAVRCFEGPPGGRFRYAHTAPVHVELQGLPLRPRRAEVEYMVTRMKEELARNKGLLDEASLAEYAKALAYYERLLPNAVEE